MSASPRWIGLVLLAPMFAVAYVACAPIEPRPVRPLSPPPTTVAPRGPDWLSKNAEGELVVPRTVQIHLTDLDGTESIELADASGRSRVVSRLRGGVAIDGTVGRVTEGQPLRLAGPVVIRGRIHEGELFVATHSKGGLEASVRLALETYIAGVVAAELPIWSAEPAELEAQAIAARTFATAAIAKRRKDGEPARLTDGVLDQAYRGSYDGRSSRGSETVAARLRAAVQRTTGQVLVRGDRLEEARYHAACGGHTANFADVFAEEVKRYDARGPTGRPCPSCRARAQKEQANGWPDAERPLSWVVTLGPDQLARLGTTFELGGPLSRIEAVRTDPFGRWLEARVIGDQAGAKTVTIPFDAIRRALGYGELKSALIDALAPAAGTPIPRGASLRLQGRGRGHGVGLCQEGARDLARNGSTAEEILRHYYPGTEIRRIDSTELP
ncbi:Stage II sporulation protein [Planctomycetes bacterium Poly30]|uniref:Stage II sporulation protein n=1 Tax=Saltatorellus ferox TaxID=2528018 RepID=A0A518ES20_9BACT|nr:Stage II sporulation protein [Planctomycetes bacterium Poly30]